MLRGTRHFLMIRPPKIANIANLAILLAILAMLRPTKPFQRLINRNRRKILPPKVVVIEWICQRLVRMTRKRLLLPKRGVGQKRYLKL